MDEDARAVQRAIPGTAFGLLFGTRCWCARVGGDAGRRYAISFRAVVDRGGISRSPTRLRKLFGNAHAFHAAPHLGPDFAGFNIECVPQNDQVIEKIGTFADRLLGPLPHRLESDLGSLLDNLLRDLPQSGIHQLCRASMLRQFHIIQRVVELL